MTLNDILGCCFVIYTASVLINLVGLAITELGDDDKKGYLMGIPILNTILAVRCLWLLLKEVFK